MKLLAVLALFFLSPAVQAAGPNAFEFVAIGDMPYILPGDYERFDRLIDKINAAKPAFTLHVGDIMSGRTPCTDDNMAKVFAQFARFEGPLVYTPGDNEWTDCHRLLQGSFDPLDRLARVRTMFFANPQRSLGKASLSVESQAKRMADRFPAYIENARFSKNGVVIATVHVVGSNNNSDPKRPAAEAEFIARDAANEAWIDDTFDQAGKAGAKAVVLAWQANVHHLRADLQGQYSPAFARTIAAVDRGARAFGKPVLVVYGDYHFFEVSRFWTAPRRAVPNVAKLQVFGETLVHGVTVTVDPDAPGVFGYIPLIVPENGPQ